MVLAQYLLKLIEGCSEEAFGQEAVEYAVLSGIYEPTFDLEADLRQIMGEEGKPETGLYDTFCNVYRAYSRANEAVVAQANDPQQQLRIT